MMMSRPTTEKEEEAPPAFATAPGQAPQMGSVEDLEQKLKMLSGPRAPPAAMPAPAMEERKPYAIPAPATAPAAAAPVKGGKNALLARIMAAKEKSQAAQTKKAPPQQEPVDLLGDFDAPGTANDPPPMYDTNFLDPPPPMSAAALPPPTDMAPPAFDAVEQQMEFLPPPPIDAVDPPPSFEASAPSAPAASAPSFEDLLDPSSQMMAPPPLSSMQAVPPPASQPEIDEDILAALDPAEREALLEEQRKIMEQIEKNKANNDASGAAARAMAFDQRSSAAVARVAGSFDRPGSTSRKAAPAARQVKTSRTSGGSRTVDLGGGEEVALHGTESTEKAIKDGTAVIVQCINCQGWMQVTENATLMFCPTCQVVSPVDKTGAATSADMEAAAQLAADQQLAEKLQSEEYARAEGSRPRAKPKQAKPQRVEEGQSWYDWLVGSPAQPAVPAQGSAEIRRPPAVGGSSPLVAVTTGEEASSRPRSYDQGRSPPAGARMAEQKGMFSCVADSISTGLTAAFQDDEGNVHGVDSSSLLAMPDVSRQRHEG